VEYHSIVMRANGVPPARAGARTRTPIVPLPPPHWLTPADAGWLARPPERAASAAGTDAEGTTRRAHRSARLRIRNKIGTPRGAL
jgi:hypothetical protein